MTPEEFLNQFCKPDDYNKLEEQLKDGLWTNNVLIYMRDYARLMCDKQKEICTNNANTKLIDSGWDIYNAVDESSILNAPYPDELQSNN